MDTPALTIARAASPADIPRLGTGLISASRPTWLVAEIVGDAQVLGRWQRRGGMETAVRRLAGGKTIACENRMILMLCALPRWDALGAPDAERVLNRHVRPIRAALAKVLRRGVAYLGRDHLVSASPGSGDRTPLAWIGQAVFPGGATLIEALVTAEIPPGRFDDLVAALAEAAGAERSPSEPSLGEAVVEDDDSGFVESGRAEVPIGAIEALVRHDGAHIVAARLRGEVQGSLDAYGDALTGTSLELDAVRAAGASALAQPGAILFGMRDPALLADLVMRTRDIALAALAEKYAVLAALRARREASPVGFDGDELAARGAAFRAVASRHPGALRELEAHAAATLMARAQAVEHARSAGGPVREPWIRAVLDFHQTLAAALSARRATKTTPRTRILDVVFDEVSRRQGAAPADIEELVFGAARRHRAAVE